MKALNGNKKLVALVAGLAMIIGMAGVATADTVTVSVDVTPAMVEAFAEYGVDADTLAKASDDLSYSERYALASIYDDADVRGAINGVVLSELWGSVADDETIASVTLAGRVYSVGMPEAFED